MIILVLATYSNFPFSCLVCPKVSHNVHPLSGHPYNLNMHFGMKLGEIILCQIRLLWLFLAWLSLSGKVRSYVWPYASELPLLGEWVTARCIARQPNFFNLHGCRSQERHGGKAVPLFSSPPFSETRWNRSSICKPLDLRVVRPSNFA